MRTRKTLCRPQAWRLTLWLGGAHLLSGCGPSAGDSLWDPLPQCRGSGDQILSTNQSGDLSCKTLPPGVLLVPSCKKYSQALTADGSRVLCSHRNNEAQATRDALDSLEQSEILIQQYTTQLSALGGPASPPPRAVYCGLFTATPNQSGAISDSATGVTGISAAATLCRKVASCSPRTAKMCTVYDLYQSAALGFLPSLLPQSWVFMASWQHNDAAQVPSQSGLADNCSGYTYGLDDKLWYGTTVEWKSAPSGHQALHFASGPGVVACSARFPIACCN